MKKTSFGTFFELGGRGAMEALTRTGLDYVIIDTEHGCLSVETAADMVLAAENGGLLPYVRIGDTLCAEDAGHRRPRPDRSKHPQH